MPQKQTIPPLPPGFTIAPPEYVTMGEPEPEAPSPFMPDFSTPLRALKGVARGGVNLVTSPIGLIQAAMHPMDSIVEPMVNEAAKAQSAQSPYEKFGHTLASGIPFLGPWAAGLGEQAGAKVNPQTGEYEPGDIAGAVAEAATTLGAPAAIRAGWKGIPRAASALEERAAANRMPLELPSNMAELGSFLLKKGAPPTILGFLGSALGNLAGYPEAGRAMAETAAAIELAMMSPQFRSLSAGAQEAAAAILRKIRPSETVATGTPVPPEAPPMVKATEAPWRNYPEQHGTQPWSPGDVGPSKQVVAQMPMQPKPSRPPVEPPSPHSSSTIVRETKVETPKGPGGGTARRVPVDKPGELEQKLQKAQTPAKTTTQGPGGQFKAVTPKAGSKTVNIPGPAVEEPTPPVKNKKPPSRKK